MIELTDRQQEIFDFILEYLEENHSVPRSVDIADHFEVNNNAAYEHLLALKRKGAIEYLSDTKNGRYRLCNFQVTVTRYES